MDIRRSADQFQATSLSGHVMRAGHNFFRTTLPGNVLLKAWKGWEHIITEGLRTPEKLGSVAGGRRLVPGLGTIESYTHNAMLGKALKDSGFIDSYRSVIKMQDQAVQDLVKGQLTANKADKLARAVDEMMGNWTNLTPDVRFAVSKITPFGLWWLNSMRWLYRLPVTHPVKTAIVASLYNATRTERGKKGQGFDAAHPVPAFLQGSIDTHLPFVGKVQIQPSYYSPGGTAGPEIFNTAAEQFLPAGASVYAAARNQNPLTGYKLTTAKGKELNPLQIGLNVATEAAAGPTPFATQAQQLLQKGGKPYGTANLVTDVVDRLLGGPRQVKPGTERPLPEVLTKMFSPVRFAFPGKSKGETAPASSLSPRQQIEVHEAEQSAGPSGLTARQQIEVEEAERAAGIHH